MLLHFAELEQAQELVLVQQLVQVPIQVQELEEEELNSQPEQGLVLEQKQVQVRYTA